MDLENPDIRWKQRFTHYKKAFSLLELFRDYERKLDNPAAASGE